MARIIDLMICIFPFEKALYEKSGLKTVFVGHPLLDSLACRRIGGGRDPALVGIFPGSRRKEIEKIFPVMIEAARMMRQSHPEMRFEAAAVSEAMGDVMRKTLKQKGLAETFCAIKSGTSHELMQRALVAMVASGTATLEAAYFGLPFVILYRVGPITLFLGHLLVKVPFLGMVNILAGREIAREFLHSKVTPQPVATEMLRLFENKEARMQTCQDLFEGDRGAWGGGSGSPSRGCDRGGTGEMLTVSKKHQAIPPGPKSKFAAGIFIDLRRDPLGFLRRAAAEYGDVYHLQLGPRHNYLINNPEHIKNILCAPQGMARSNHPSIKRLLGKGLITSQAEFHRRQRRLIQPAFHRGQIALWSTVMTDYATQMIAGWNDGETLNISEEMSRLALSIIVNTMSGSDVQKVTEGHLGVVWSTVMGMSHLHNLPFLTDFLLKLPLPNTRRLEKAVRSLDETIYRMIAERRKSGEARQDLLSILIGMWDSETDSGGLTDREIRDEVLTMFTAGHETISNALVWTCYLLSQHAPVEKALHAELDSVLGGRVPTADDLPRLPYTKMVFSESMRMYPPVWVIARRNVEDYRLGDYLIPAGSFLYLSQYVLHHDSRYFPDPDRFDPLRWTPEAIAERPKFSYFPFGGGPRQCVGEGFAWMEGILTLATVAQHWKLELAPRHKVEIEPFVTLRPKFGMRMTLRRRRA